MSFNRENVVWESEDGRWNIGFYESYVSPYAEDSEWDADYNYDKFEWVSTSHPSAESAIRSWDGSNPGGHDIVSYKGRESFCQTLDDMAASCNRAQEEFHMMYNEAKRAELMRLLSEHEQAMWDNQR